jgi:hypothetical protein
MKVLNLLLSLLLVMPAFAQKLAPVQTECTRVRNDPNRPKPMKSNGTVIGKDMVCQPTHQGPISTLLQPLLRLGNQPAGHSGVPMIDSPPPRPVKTAMINSVETEPR